MPDWFLMISDKRIGPIEEDKVIDYIKAKKINSNTLVWKEGQKDWIALGTVQYFQEALNANEEKKGPPDFNPKGKKVNMATTCFCRNCGEQINEKAVVCLNCGANPLNSTDYCQHCGAETNPKAVVCVKCGCKLSSPSSGILSDISAGGDYITPSDPPKDPLLMALLSGCCLAWLGQILLGQTTKGLVMLAVSISLVFFGVGILFWPIAAVDAYLIAKKLQDGKPVKQWEFF